MSIEKISSWLRKQGLTPRGGPIFQLVWSDTQVEIRKGTFNEFYGSIFLRTTIGVKEVPKYNYLKNRWVLEKWVPTSNDELPKSRDEGTYEPFWVFQDKNGEYLQPTMKVVQFIVNAARQVVKSPLSEAANLLSELKGKEDREIQDFMEQIDSSPTQNALHLGEGVGYTKGLKNVD